MKEMSSGFSKYKHDTVGKFHPIRKMVEYIESGTVNPAQGLMAIHELVAKMIFTSKEQTRGYCDCTLIVARDEDHLFKGLGGKCEGSLKPLKVAGTNIFATTMSDRQYYVLFSNEDLTKQAFLLGKIVSYLPISEVIMGEFSPELETAFIAENVRIHRFEREDLCTQ